MKSLFLPAEGMRLLYILCFVLSRCIACQHTLVLSPLHVFSLMRFLVFSEFNHLAATSLYVPSLSFFFFFKSLADGAK